ncbi:hypothetical protein Q5530_28370 [Saccharothrix sp. BKS2]|uniref:Uncharacterized protein n=1 Tax=Saccharothrix lopnurensis TaxID=1670621 RepID=A0ABW1PG61_9PSEU
MASLFSKIAAFARSPQGRRLVDRAKHTAQDPRSRAKAQEMMRKFRKR